MALEPSGYFTISTWVLESGLNTEVIARPLLIFTVEPDTAQRVSAFVLSSCPKVSDSKGSVQYLNFCLRRSSSVPRAPAAITSPFDLYVIRFLLSMAVIFFVSTVYSPPVNMIFSAFDSALISRPHGIPPCILHILYNLFSAALRR